MKIIYVTVVFSLFINICLAQKTKSFNMVKVMQKPIVDTFINRLFKSGTLKTTNSDTSSALFITIETLNNNTVFIAFLADSIVQNTVFISKDFILKKKNFRYCVYNNYHVFFCGDIDPFNLFIITEQTKKFTLKFEYDKQKTNDSNYGYGYVFKNGYFNNWIPAVR